MRIKRLAYPSGVVRDVVAASREVFARIAEESGYLTAADVQRLFENGQPVYTAFNCYVEMKPVPVQARSTATSVVSRLKEA
jgi:hypothetical protein